MRRPALAPLNLDAYKPEPSVMELATRHRMAIVEKERTEAKAASHPARASFGAFVEATTGWKLDDWQWKICNRLGEIVEKRQEGVRVLIHSFPQAGKSVLVSQRFPAYTLGYIPDYRLRLACYNQEHAERFGEVVVQVLNDPAFRFCFPDAEPPPLRSAAKEWSTGQREAKMDGQPSFRALGIRAGFVGLGADLLIVDDPYAGADEAYSDTINANVWRWWTDTVAPRLNPLTNVVVMFHRWRNSDLAGMLMQQGGWEVMRFPAIADGLEHDCSGLPVGEILSPRYPRSFIENFKAAYPLQFASLYQGMPGDAFGNLIRSDWFRSYHDKGDFYVLDKGDGRQETVRKSSVWIMASVDWASSDAKKADSSDVTILGVTPRRDLLVLEDKNGREEGPEAVKMVDAVLRKWDPQVVLSEKNALGLPMTQYLSRLGWTVRGIWQHLKKEVRAQSVAEGYQAGRVYHPATSPQWLLDFCTEILAYPLGDHDERIDTMSAAIRSLPGITSVISDFSQALHVALDPLPYNPESGLFLGWAVEPMPSCVIATLENECLAVYMGLSASVGEGLDGFILRVADWLKAEFEEPVDKLPLRHFGSDKWLGTTVNHGPLFYKTAGFSVAPVRNLSENGDEAIRLRCKQFSKGLPHLWIDPNATELIGALSVGYAYKVNKEGLPTPQVEVNASKALCEALGALCASSASLTVLAPNPIREMARQMRVGTGTGRAVGGRRR